jgi:pyrroline-5-carboxylate reductase
LTISDDYPTTYVIHTIKKGAAMDLKTTKICIIGGGMMAENILRGMLRAQLIQPDQISVSDIHAGRLTYIRDTFNVMTTRDNVDIAGKADIIILAVKPQNIKILLGEIQTVLSEKHLVISIAAGVKTRTLSDGSGGKARFVRTMPNIGAKVLASATAICPGPGATQGDLLTAQQIFEAIGSTVMVNEDLMDAVTGLSGSGPAYFFLFIEALADAGVRAGLMRPVALQLAAQTCLGAAQLVLETGEHPAVLKDQVTSPGGTTIEGLRGLEAGAVRAAIINAVSAAIERSKELGKG